MGDFFAVCRLLDSLALTDVQKRINVRLKLNVDMIFVYPQLIWGFCLAFRRTKKQAVQRILCIACGRYHRCYLIFAYFEETQQGPPFVRMEYHAAPRSSTSQTLRYSAAVPRGNTSTISPSRPG